MKRQLFQSAACAALLVLSVACGRRSGSGEGPLVLDIASAVGAGEVCEPVCGDMFEVAGWTTIGTEDSVLLVYPQIFGYKDGEIYLYDGMSETFFRVRERDGKILSRFCRKGRGPGEYVSLGTACLDGARNMILVSDVSMKRILAYTSEGRYLPEYSRDSLIGAAVLADGNILALNPVDPGRLYAGTEQSGACYDIYDAEWNLIRRGTVMQNTKRSFMIGYPDPVISLDGECYYSPYRSDTLYRVTADADIPALVFDKGRYAISDEAYMNPEMMVSGGPGISDISTEIIGPYAFCDFYITLDGLYCSQVWDMRDGKFVYAASSEDSRPGFRLKSDGVELSVSPSFVVDGEIFSILDYDDALRLVPDLDADANPVLLHLRYKE